MLTIKEFNDIFSEKNLEEIIRSSVKNIKIGNFICKLVKSSDTKGILIKINYFKIDKSTLKDKIWSHMVNMNFRHIELRSNKNPSCSTIKFSLKYHDNAKVLDIYNIIKEHLDSICKVVIKFESFSGPLILKDIIKYKIKEDEVYERKEKLYFVEKNLLQYPSITLINTIKEYVRKNIDNLEYHDDESFKIFDIANILINCVGYDIYKK